MLPRALCSDLVLQSVAFQCQLLLITLEVLHLLPQPPLTLHDGVVLRLAKAHLLFVQGRLHEVLVTLLNENYTPHVTGAVMVVTFPSLHTTQSERNTNLERRFNLMKVNLAFQSNDNNKLVPKHLEASSALFKILLVSEKHKTTASCIPHVTFLTKSTVSRFK